YVDVGLKLEVEPNIYLDDEVAIKVNLEVSSLVRELLSKSGTLSYQIGTRGASTSLRLKDGETQILAGLISDEDRTTGNRVPLLGELPIAGRLFGSQKDDKQRSEIILSITPRIVRSLRRPELLAAEFDSGTETSIGAEPLRLSMVEPEAKPGDPKAVKPASAADAPRTQAPTPGASPAAGGAVVAPIVSTPAATPGAASVPGAIRLDWQAPAQVKVGEQFSAVVRLSSQGPLRGLPLLAGFDPQLLQVVQVTEGGYFRQGGAKVNFSQRVDAAQGKVFAAAVLQGGDAGINGSGGVMTVTFKAIKLGAAKLQLLSASPEPAPASPLPLPIEQVVKVVP
ncbi:MAG: cohesin domain-containing protein, partial [Burkholderiaceae bacterium]